MSTVLRADSAAPITALPPGPCFEFAAYTGHAPGAGILRALPGRAGAVLRDASGTPSLLHFAPRRWLAPAPHAPLLGVLTRLEQEGCGVLVDVAGKWRQVQIAARHAGALLSASIDWEAVLADRDCAAAVVFDCPAILARAGEDCAVWLAASFIESFIAVCASVPSPRSRV